MRERKQSELNRFATTHILRLIAEEISQMSLRIETRDMEGKVNCGLAISYMAFLSANLIESVSKATYEQLDIDSSKELRADFIEEFNRFFDDKAEK